MATQGCENVSCVQLHQGKYPMSASQQQKNKGSSGNSKPLRLLLIFMGVILGGAFLLSWSAVQQSDVGFLDALFTATSAVTTTGLTTVTTVDSYNFWGQLIVLILIQVGGIGYLTFASLFLMGDRELDKDEKQVATAQFTLPSRMSLHHFLKNAIIYTVAVELLGMLLLLPVFRGEGMDWGDSVWYSLFHSISAFCTAGFGLYENSLIDFSSHTYLNLVIAGLALAGALGFIVITDIWAVVRGHRKKITFTSKAVLWGMLTLLVLGASTIYLTHTSLESSGAPLLASFFQTVTAHSGAGFNTVDIANLRMPVLMIMMLLMFIGASPSGTAGGIKLTTALSMLAIVQSTLLDKQEVAVGNVEIPDKRLRTAAARITLYILILFLGITVVSAVEAFSFKEIVFECLSALATVGLSTGITSELSEVTKWVLILLMFVGRVGLLTVGTALTGTEQETANAKADLAV